MSDIDVLARLDSFIDYESPELSSFLYRMWDDQQQAVTYKELREAILSGELPLEYLDQWQKDYSAFLVEAYTPHVERAILQAANDLRREYGPYFYDPVSTKIDSFIQHRGGQLIRQVTRQQYQAVNLLVRQAALTETMTVDQLARAIRPCIGLTGRQSAQTYKYYESLISEGISPKKAKDKQAKFAAKLHRQRAATIAQTEMAIAYNEGLDQTVRQSMQDGILPQNTGHQWFTALDERVCPECGAVHGEVVQWGKPFSNGKDKPPAHPRCRCCAVPVFGPVSNNIDLKESFAYIHDLPEERRTEILGGKTKRALYDADMLEPEDYFKPLREIDTDGIIIPSGAALNHSAIGEYGAKSGRLLGGCHLQEGMSTLNSKGIEYHVTRTSSNGVRYGYIPTHKEPVKKSGEGQAWFPTSWTREDVRSAGVFVANKGTVVDPSRPYAKEAWYNGVNVRVLQDGAGQITTICPSYDQ